MRAVWRRRRAVAGVVLAGALVILAGLSGAQAQEALSVRIRQALLDPGGEVRLVVSIAGHPSDRILGASNFHITEQGEPVRDFRVEPLLESRLIHVGVVLLMDVSGSMRGQPMEDAKAAARSFVEALPPGIQVALVPFSTSARVEVGFTEDRALLTQGVDALVAEGSTALYEGVAMGAALLAEFDGQRNLVVFSDGGDTVGTPSLEEAIAAAKSIEAPITSVALITSDLDEAALVAMAQETGGATLSAAESGALLEAFREVAREIASQYLLTYSASRLSSELDLAVSVRIERGTASDQIAALNPRVRARTISPPIEAATGIFATPVGLYGGLAAAFAGLGLLLYLAFAKPPANPALKALRSRINAASAGTTAAPDGAITSSVGRRAVAFAEHLPKPKRYEQKIQELLEQAGWPMRASEFLVLQSGSALAAGLIGLALLGLLFGLLTGIVGALLPRLVMRHRRGRRRAKFMEQLPDTLQLLAGSVKAGYGLMQAMDIIVQETEPPTSTEFGRVLAEARLGMPLDDSLGQMAERIGSEDLRWAVIAITIQRQVGGNLAELLETVAETIRSRDQLRRQVKALSAEGRLSAVVLTVLPFALAGYMALVNREYLANLFNNVFGILLVAVAALAMAVGIVWMRKIIRIEV